MLTELGFTSLDELTDAVVPQGIRWNQPLHVGPGMSEEQALESLKRIAAKNRLLRSFIGAGYYNTITPKVIQRNVLENPAWYTSYTPYQPEISQGRLEVLFYYQTLVSELTGLEIANASLLDEATAAAEAMALAHRTVKGTRFLISTACHPQTIEVVRTRAIPLGVAIETFDERQPIEDWKGIFGVLIQYPGTDGSIVHPKALIDRAHQNKALVVVATDLLALMMLPSPGSLGADIAVGSAQRFGVPFGFGGPHAAFFATRDAYKRTMPGRIVGQSIDRHGKPAFRLALQTREQHIRREKATSNICTAQALLAIMSTLYACYHGPEGLRAIARRVHGLTSRLYRCVIQAGLKCRSDRFFDTLAIVVPQGADAVMTHAVNAGYNLRRLDDSTIGISLDETTTESDLQAVAKILGIEWIPGEFEPQLRDEECRNDVILTQDVFHRYRAKPR
jgi:glycine dehydrogenase